MPSSYTTSLRLTLPATGELSGQWGNTVNTGITELLDSAVAGTASISTWGGAGVAYTLSSTSGAADEARKMFIVASGSPGEAKNVICPAVSKFYVFRNDTTGGFALTLKTPSGTGISVPAGQYKFLYCDGTNVVEMFNSAGALSLSGNLTLSGGTANGVLYLNGSKVATSGSALVFDGTNLGLGTTSSAWTSTYKAFALGSVNSNLSGFWDGTTAITTVATGGAVIGGAWTYTMSGQAVSRYAQLGSGAHAWFTAPSGTAGNAISFTQAMTLDASGNLLVGTTTSPGSPNAQIVAAGTTDPGIQLASTSNGGGLILGAGGGGIGLYTYTGAIGSESYSERARIDTSGNLGIGTSSPTVITAGSRVLEVSGAGDYFPSINLARTGASGYTNVNWKQFLSSDGGLYFRQNSTDRMVLDSSGNLGLGVTPSAWNTVTAFQVKNASLYGYSFDESGWQQNAYYATGWKYITTGYAASQYMQVSGTHRWYTAPSGTAGNAITFTQAMTLDASGLLAIGRTSAWDSNALLTLEKSGVAAQVINCTTNTVTLINVANGGASIAYTGTASNHPFAFYTNNTERARITSGGDLLVGTTTVGSSLTEGFSLQMGGGASQIHIGHTGGIGSGELYAGFSRGGTTIGSISQNGTTAVLYNTTSDQRLKENIVDAPEASALIDAIQVRSFDWKSDGSHQRYGMVAQELALVAPEAVHAPADPDAMMAVDYSKLVPMLIKEVQSLRARVAALEAQP